MTTDSAIIADSLAHPARFGELFERHADSVLAYLARRADPQIAEDLLAETFLRAFEARRRFEAARDSAAPWLLGIATNLLRRHRRDEVRRLRAFARSAEDEGRDRTEAEDRRLDSGTALSAVARELADMPAATRDTLLLVAWAGLDYAQTAEAASVPIGTVRSRLHRARRQLRDLPEVAVFRTGESYG